MRPSILAILIFLAPVYAVPSKFYLRDIGTKFCGSVRGRCKGDGSECCANDFGVAGCVNGRVEFNQCAANENYCASFEGKSQCGTQVDGVKEKILR